MTLTLVATPSSATANCYATLAECEAYIATLSFATDWTGTTDEPKKAAIITAARWLDTLRWKGTRTEETQSMSWPRMSVEDRDGWALDETAVPTAIKNANAEMALRLLAEDRAADAGALVPNRLKVGPLEIETLRRRMVPPSVTELCDYLLEIAPGQARLVRG